MTENGLTEIPAPPYTQVVMRRPNLLLPPIVAPEGYAVRLHREDQDAALAEVLSAAFPDYRWTVDLVRSRLTKAEDVEAVYVATYADEPVATASARVAPGQWGQSGYVHWVGAHPAHRGKGLGRLVTLRVLRHFAEAGRTDAVLETDDERLHAIRIYLELGFVPEPSRPGHAERWEAILRALRG